MSAADVFQSDADVFQSDIDVGRLESRRVGLGADGF